MMFVSCVTVASEAAVLHLVLLRRLSGSVFGVLRVRQLKNLVPDGLRELCEGCFERCESLRRVTFCSSLLERLGALCFYGCRLDRFEISVSLRAIGEGAFGECALPRGMMCRDACDYRFSLLR